MKKIFIIAFAVLVCAGTANAVSKKTTKKANTQQCCEKPVVLQTETDSLSYANGMAVTQGLIGYLQQSLGLDTMYMADFKKGFKEAIQCGTDPKYVAQVAGTQIAQQVMKQILPNVAKEVGDSLSQEMFYEGFIAGAMNDKTLFSVDSAIDYAKKHKEAKDAKYKEEQAKWLEENGKKEGIVTMPSGLQYKEIIPGTGAIAQKDDKVTVKYEGRLINGTVFDSSYTRNPDTTTFSPGQVIKGWTEALCMMPEGAKWELYIPQNLAYGERGAGKDIAPYSTLIFTVEIVKVEKKN